MTLFYEGQRYDIFFDLQISIEHNFSHFCSRNTPFIRNKSVFLQVRKLKVLSTMRSRIYWITAVVLGTTLMGYARSEEKMSFFVRRAMAEHAKVKRVGGQVSERKMTVFVSVHGADVDSLFAANDCRQLDRKDDICIVSVPLSRLSALASSEKVGRIEASALPRLTMDTTTSIIDALPAYEGKALPQAYGGRGVVLGIMDVGFDLTHPNFLDGSTGKSRIRAFWDQLEKEGDGKMPVGRDYTTPEGILAKRHSADGFIQSHGTHTLGCAAGSGSGSPYRGVAYDSDICAVSNAVTSSLAVIDSADLYKYTTAIDALGFKYIFDYASSVGKPCVASFSEGYTVGADSEDSLFCAYLDKLTGPGRILVASAGNESLTPGYLKKEVGRYQAGSYLLSYSDEAYLYAEADQRFTMSLIATTNGGADTLRINSGLCPADSVVAFSLAGHDGRHLLDVSVYSYHSAFDEGRNIHQVHIQAPSQVGVDVPLAVVVSGLKANVELRCMSSTFFDNGRIDSMWSDAEVSHNVNAPGCFESVLTVGSTIHRTGFTNYKGQYLDYSQPGRNDGVRSRYSSIGPGMGGVVKPDVMAPGDNVISSYSSFYLEHNPDAGDINSDVSHFDYAGRTYAWNANTGTSMATPVVAGAVALWLQANPTLSPTDVKDIIRRTARHPEEMDYPNNYYGYGEIDVYRGLLSALNLDAIHGLSIRHLSQTKVSLTSDGRLVVRMDTPPRQRFVVTLFALSGKKISSDEVIPYSGKDEFTIPAGRLPQGVYLVQIDSREQAVRGSTLVRK